MAISVLENIFQLNIVSADGSVHALAVSGTDEELGIQPGHPPLLTKLKSSVASFVDSERWYLQTKYCYCVGRSGNA